MNPDVWAFIADTPVRTWVIGSPYVWPTLESIHFASLCVLMGSILVVDLRLVGVYRKLGPTTVRFLVRLSIAAFVVNMATGLLFFLGNTYKYVDNAAFELKLALIAVAGLNAVFYKWRLERIVESEDVSLSSIGVGCLSLLLWSGVIVCGRMITFYAP